jgi:rubredoxin
MPVLEEHRRSKQMAHIAQPCPKCGGSKGKVLKYIWWGGRLAPKLFSLVRCAKCGTVYAANSGREASSLAVGYVVVVYPLIAAMLIGVYYLIKFMISDL